jgi:hypothetical protein
MHGQQNIKVSTLLEGCHDHSNAGNLCTPVHLLNVITTSTLLQVKQDVFITTTAVTLNFSIKLSKWPQKNIQKIKKSLFSCRLYHSSIYGN